LVRTALARNNVQHKTNRETRAVSLPLKNFGSKNFEARKG
jgi:hypothetical protein